MRKKEGFTLIEVIITIVLMSIFMYAGIFALITASTGSLSTEFLSVAESLAEGKMEETLSKSFANVLSEAETNYSGNLSNYSYEVVADFVSFEALDTTVASSDYKRIQVKIRHSELDSPVQLESVKTNY